MRDERQHSISAVTHVPKRVRKYQKIFTESPISLYAVVCYTHQYTFIY